MQTRHPSFRSSVSALVVFVAVFFAPQAQANPNLFPSDDKLIKLDCTAGKCKTIPRGQLPTFVAELISAEGLPCTPEVLGLFYLKAMKVACDLPDGQRLILHPRLHGFSTPPELAALAQKTGCAHLSYAFNYEEDMVIPTEVPPCLRDRAACNEHVGRLETRLAVVDSCKIDELFDSRTGKCVKKANDASVIGLRAALLEQGTRYSALRSALGNCAGRVTLDEQDRPVCHSAGAAGLVWPWQALSVVLAALCVVFYLSRRVIARTLKNQRDYYAQSVDAIKRTAEAHKQAVVASLKAELRREKQSLAEETTLRARAEQALGVVQVERDRLRQERDVLRADRAAMLMVLDYDVSHTAAEAATDLVKKIHQAAGTPLAKRGSTTPWAAVSALELNARGLARRVRTLTGRLTRVGRLLEVNFDAEGEEVDEILPALGELREQLGIRGAGSGYTETILQAVARLKRGSADLHQELARAQEEIRVLCDHAVEVVATLPITDTTAVVADPSERLCGIIDLLGQHGRAASTALGGNGQTAVT